MFGRLHTQAALQAIVQIGIVMLAIATSRIAVSELSRENVVNVKFQETAELTDRSRPALFSRELQAYFIV